MSETAVSVMGGTFRESVPFDLTGYKKIVRTQDFPLDKYDVSNLLKTMEITITNDTNYLNDAEFWTYMTKRNSANGNYIQSTALEDDIIYESGNMIDSIEVFADSQRLFYIKDA